MWHNYCATLGSGAAWAVEVCFFGTAEPDLESTLGLTCNGLTQIAESLQQ
jgi:hypothetical protein